jgi:hypothetical protein
MRSKLGLHEKGFDPSMPLSSFLPQVWAVAGALFVVVDGRFGVERKLGCINRQMKPVAICAFYNVNVNKGQ